MKLRWWMTPQCTGYTLGCGLHIHLYNATALTHVCVTLTCGDTVAA